MAVIRTYAIFLIGITSLTVTAWAVRNYSFKNDTSPESIMSEITRTESSDMHLLQTQAIQSAEKTGVPYYSYKLEGTVPPPVM